METDEIRTVELHNLVIAGNRSSGYVASGEFESVRRLGIGNSPETAVEALILNFLSEKHGKPAKSTIGVQFAIQDIVKHARKRQMRVESKGN